MAGAAARRVRSAGLVVGGVALGVGVAVGLPKLTGGDDAPPALGRSADVASSELLDPVQLSEVDGDRVRADSPREAVEEFLEAEQDGDDERSFALLADGVRLDYGSAAAWAADPDGVAPVVGYEVVADGDDSAATTVVETETRYRSSLDAVAGLVPARARTSWAVVREEGGWAVDLFATEQVPLLPPDDGAADAVRSWAADAQACTPQERPLAGSPALASALCGTTGAVGVGTPASPGPLEVGQLTSAFGADLEAWARVVDVTSPSALRAVVAPVDDRWTVVAVLPASAGS